MLHKWKRGWINVPCVAIAAVAVTLLDQKAAGSHEAEMGRF